jgi:hypothetical protein
VPVAGRVARIAFHLGVPCGHRPNVEGHDRVGAGHCVSLKSDSPMA